MNKTFTAYLKLKGYSTKSIASIEKIVEYFIRWCETEQISDITEVSHSDILAYVRYLNVKGVSKKTTAHYVLHVRKYFDYLETTGEINDNPCSHITIKGIKRKVLHEVLSKEELEAIYTSYQTTIEIRPLPHAPPQVLNELTRRRNKVILGLIVYQGLRSGEIQQLELSDLKLREGKLLIRSGRRSAERTLTLESHQVYDLLDYVNETRKQLLRYAPKEATNKVFVTKGTGTTFTNTMCYLLTQIQALNPKVKSLEQLRASVITDWLKSHNLRQVQYLAGHRYVSSTEKYQANNLDELKENIKQFHPF